ncbi:peptidoglycan recognition family protein [Nonomuraea sp. NPDC004580]|uniref:peptidoglycan recognition protein family protein n=1 Tax=Nonomuraea sp. NPDC004580 TaxID=3154552 RepID=UPI0033B8A2A6
MRITPRSAFGWPPSAADTANPRLGLVVHYDGSNQGLAGRPHSACIAYWKSTRTFHTGSARGWADIGYSFAACPHGEVFEGRGLGRYQAAQGTTAGNANWYSVTLMSGPGEDPTPAQIDAVRQLRAWLMSKGVGGGVRGHRDFVSTSCPGDRLYGLIKGGVFGRAPDQQEEGDVSAKDNWQHELKVPYGSEDNPAWQAGNILVNNGVWLRKISAQVAAQSATITAMAEALAARDGEIDVEALVQRINDAISQVTVRLDVPDPA